MVTRTSPKSLREKGPTLQWTANLKTEEERKEFTQLMGLSNSPVTRRLLEIIQKEIEQSQKNILSNNNYDSPSWAYIQADNVGYQRALRLVELLLKDLVK